MLCSDWVAQIKRDGFEDSESIILACVEANNKILLSNKGVNELLINSINI